MQSNYEIRKKARETLGGGIFKNEWLYAMVICLCEAAIIGILSATMFGAFILSGILTCAVAYYFVNRVRGRVAYDGLSTVIDGAKADPVGSIITGILVSVFTALWTLLFIIPGIVKACAYSMAFYVKNDRPELSAKEAIDESQRLMDGFKMKFFILQLSFIGWYILGALCFGVGILWVNAYTQAANAHFYEQVLAAKTYIVTDYVVGE